MIPVFVISSMVVIKTSTSSVLQRRPVACSSTQYSDVFDTSERLAVYDGKQIQAPLLVRNFDIPLDTSVLGLATASEKWIEVDLSDQLLRAWNGNTLYLETDIASGLPWTPTPPGEYHIWAKLRYTRMEGGSGAYYYNLPNVPFTMFFSNDKVPSWRGYGLHGTYWHNSFGTPRSHGCVNLPTPMAEKIYYWADPVLPEGKSSIYADENNPGTRILIHE